MSWSLFICTLWTSSLLSFSIASSIPASSFGIPGRNSTFDYVIIGGGTTGLAVATRLAQGLKSVAIIEAGGFYAQDVGNVSYIPADAVQGAGSSPTDFNPGDDWGFITTPQKGMNGRRLHYARGKTLGGSSARNYFTYHRPTIGSLNLWASAVGDDSYRYDQFYPYYQKSINYTSPNNSMRPQNASVPSPSDAFNPNAGPLRVSFPTWANSFSSFVKVAWQQLGIPVANDFVSGKLNGVQYGMNTINPNGQIRDSSYSSFLQSVAGHASLQVYNNTLAKKILFTNDSTAIGVLVNSSGVEYVLQAKNEIILSAGVFQSPQLLIISGVGPADTLQRFNIPIVSQLKGVGQNLQDHLLLSSSYQVNTLTHSALTNPKFLAEAKKEYNKNGSGILGNPGGEIITWERVSASDNIRLSSTTRQVLSTFPSDWPTFEYLALDAFSGNNENYITGAPKTPFMYASPAAVTIVPQSRGNVTITGTDASLPPVINPNWLTSPVDIELALLSFNRTRQMMDTNVMSPIHVKELVPGRNITGGDALLNAIRNTAIQLFHASATCKMGKKSDSQAVVNSRGQVYGTQRLRVIDASALPFLPPGHPQSTLYALAEKLSADILMTSY